MIAVPDLPRLRDLVGTDVGASDWITVDQARITAFAEATGDHQWIHVDEARAATDTASGTTIAHGFLTLSLISALLRDAIAIGGIRMTINYGLNRVRFVSPVPAGSRIRAQISLTNVIDAGGATQATWHVTVERDGGEKPCLVADWLVRYYPDER